MSRSIKKVAFREGFSEDEIAEAFIKYDISGRKLELDDMQMVERALFMQKGKVHEELKKQEQTTRDTNMLDFRYQHSLYTICSWK